MAIVFEYATLNGGERSMLAALDELAASRCRFAALAPAEGPLADALDSRGIPREEFACHAPRGERLPRAELHERLRAALRKLNADVVHANSLSMGRLLGAIAADLGVPTAAHLRDIVGLSRAAVEDLNRNAILLAVSRAARDFHVAQGVDPERICVLYNGVDCERFRPRSATGELRRSLGLPDDALLALTIGQIGVRKGLDVLAQAARAATERLPGVHFLIVGERHSSKAESVEFEHALLASVQTPPLAGRVHVLGRREDVDRLMNEADLLIHAARQEPLGRVLLEAAASGLPIVATDAGGTREIVEDGRSARIVPAGDPRALAAALIELNRDSALRETLAAAARERALALFPAEKSARALEAVWLELARDGGARV